MEAGSKWLEKREKRQPGVFYGGYKILLSLGYGLWAEAVCFECLGGAKKLSGFRLLITLSH